MGGQWCSSSHHLGWVDEGWRSKLVVMEAATTGCHMVVARGSKQRCGKEGRCEKWQVVVRCCSSSPRSTSCPQGAPTASHAAARAAHSKRLCGHSRGQGHRHLCQVEDKAGCLWESLHRAGSTEQGAH